MIKSFFYIFLILGLLTTSMTSHALAATSNLPVESNSSFMKHLRAVIRVDGGVATGAKGKTQVISTGPLPEVVDGYHDASSGSSVLTGGIFGGAELGLKRYLALQVGIGIDYIGQSEIKGKIFGLNDPTENHYDYHYDVQSTRVVLQTRALFTCWRRFLHPYLSAAVGLAFNRSFDFVPVKVEPTTDATDQFSDNSKSAFTYSFGAGAMFDLNQHLRLGAGIQYVGLGNFALGPSQNFPTTTTGTLTASPHVIRFLASLSILLGPSAN